MSHSIKILADATPRFSALPVLGPENCYLWCMLCLLSAPEETTSFSFEWKDEKKYFNRYKDPQRTSMSILFWFSLLYFQLTVTFDVGAPLRRIKQKPRRGNSGLEVKALETNHRKEKGYML